MQNIRALAGLAPKPLPKKLSHVGFVVHDQNADEATLIGSCNAEQVLHKPHRYFAVRFL
jgi:hypothetical protein